MWQLFYSATSTKPLNRSQLVDVALKCPLRPAETAKAIRDFEYWAQARSMGSPSSDNVIVFVQFNVFRALASNAESLGIGIRRVLDDDSISPISDPSHNMQAKMVPPTLLPTRLQKDVPHHPWIDILPIPVLRNNLLLAQDKYDEDRLCAELIGYDQASNGRCGMILWGEPWDPAGWEVTEDFLQRWGWAVSGCRELLAATNYWRRRRGKPVLSPKVVESWTTTG